MHMVITRPVPIILEEINKIIIELMLHYKSNLSSLKILLNSQYSLVNNVAAKSLTCEVRHT